MRTQELYDTYFNTVTTAEMDMDAYHEMQESVLQECIKIVKEKPDPKADYLIGSIGLQDGEKYDIPPKNIIGHFSRSYKNGELQAGVELSSIYRGLEPYMPSEYHDEEKGIKILEDLCAKSFVEAHYSLSALYIEKIMDSLQEGGYPPEKWFEDAIKHAKAADEGKFVGGPLLLGFMYDNGFGNNISPDPERSFNYYNQALGYATGHAIEYGLIADVKLNLGGLYYEGTGVGRNRKKGVVLIQESADMGNDDAREWLEENIHILKADRLLEDNTDVGYDIDFDESDFSDSH